MLCQHSFTATGTIWHLSIIAAQKPKTLWRLLENQVRDFEQDFSRFIPHSKVNQFQSSPKGTYQVDPILSSMLHIAQQFREASGGKFDPAISSLLSHTGYDSSYSFRPNPQAIADWHRPVWSIADSALTIDGPVSFDLGGFAKGYLIDLLSQTIRSHGHKYYLVDGGGDFYGSKKSDSPWRLAIENPKNHDQALCTINLQNQALAVSDILKRRWGKHHHLLDPDDKSSPQSVIACSVIAPKACIADALTTCLMLIPIDRWHQVADSYQAQYLAVLQDHTIILHPHWPGDFT